MEAYDKEIEFALIKGLDPAERIASLLKPDPEVFEDVDLNSLPQSTKDELFQQLLSAAYSTFLVSVRK